MKYFRDRQNGTKIAINTFNLNPNCSILAHGKDDFDANNFLNKGQKN